jgi:hypothetical protein
VCVGADESLLSAFAGGIVALVVYTGLLLVTRRALLFDTWTIALRAVRTGVAREASAQPASDAM